MATTNLSPSTSENYVAEVLAGKVVVSSWVRKAVERHCLDLKDGHKRGLVFDREKATRAIRFFRALSHNEDTFTVGSGAQFVLEPWQQAFLWILFGWRRTNGTRRFGTAYTEIARGNGKALALDTPLATPTGWTSQGEVKPGDELFDETGAICKVVAVGPVMHGRPCYKMTLSGGESIVADAEHEWFVFTRRSGKTNAQPHKKNRKWQDDNIRTTRQIAETLHVEEFVKSGRGLEANHRIPVCGALETPEKALPVDPYVLGAWLGDGSSGSSLITVGDADIEEMQQILTARGYPLRRMNCGVCLYSLSDGDRRQSARNVSLAARLRTLGVLDDKRIPAVYLRASTEQRLDLLRGLMDTDGSCAKNGQCEFTSIRQGLTADVVELLHSLGIKPAVYECAAMLEGRYCGQKYRISFFGTQSKRCFNLKRKAERLKTSVTLSGNRRIISAEVVDSVPVRCIQVDSPKGLYLAGREMIPTHNSKIAGGIGLYMLVGEGIKGSVVYSVATMKEQAKVVFDDAVLMAKSSPALTMLRHYKNNLHIPDTASKFEPLSSDESTLDGLKPNLIIVDELHAHKTKGVWNKCKTAMGKKPGSLMFAITTAGTDRHSVCYEQRTYAEKVLDGFEDDSYFAWICSLDAGDDPFDEVNWPKSNPNLNVSIELDKIREAAKQAQMIPNEYNEFLRMRCNIWTDSDVAWMPHHLWNTEGCSEAINVEELKGRNCFGGLDLSTSQDLTCFSLVFPPKGYDEKWKVLPFFWIPTDNVQQRVKKDRVPYDVWIAKGLLEETSGNVVDYDRIRAKIEELAELYHIEMIAYDPFQAVETAYKLEAAGLTIKPVRQGYLTLNAPTRRLMDLVVGGDFCHGGHPVLAWNAGNAMATMDAAGLIKIDKSKSRERIDGIAATINALEPALLAATDDGEPYGVEWF